MMQTKHTTPVMKGLIISAGLIVFGLILYFTHQYENNAVNSIQYLILGGGVIWSCIYYAKQMDGQVTFGNVFAEGFKTTAFVIGLMSVYTFLSIKFLYPEMVDKAIAMGRQQMEKDGKMSADQITQYLEVARKSFVPFAIGIIIVTFGVTGAIASAIGAALAKKSPQTPLTQTQF